MCMLDKNSFSIDDSFFLFIKESNPCESSPCQHQSICIARPNKNIQCICRPHFTGRFCEYPSKFDLFINIFISKFVF
jgi:hypothetical protein